MFRLNRLQLQFVQFTTYMNRTLNSLNFNWQTSYINEWTHLLHIQGYLFESSRSFRIIDLTLRVFHIWLKVVISLSKCLIVNISTRLRKEVHKYFTNWLLLSINMVLVYSFDVNLDQIDCYMIIFATNLFVKKWSKSATIIWVKKRGCEM